MKAVVQLDWFDLDDIPQIREQAEDLARRFSHSGTHTGGIGIESVEGPTEDGVLTLEFDWIDLADVPGLLKALEAHLAFDGDSTGGIGVESVGFKE